jgi:hypothetical protein
LVLEDLAYGEEKTGALRLELFLRRAGELKGASAPMASSAKPKSCKGARAGGCSIGQFVSPPEEKSSKGATRPFTIPRQG